VEGLQIEKKVMADRYKKVLTWEERGMSKIASKVLTYSMDGPRAYLAAISLSARASTVDLILATAIFRKCNIKP
jgi:hypothetical protein